MIIATINIGVGGSTSATIGATMHTSLLLTLQMPKAVATRLAGNNSIRQRHAATQPMLTPNFVIMMKTEDKIASESSLSYSRLNEPKKAIPKAMAKSVFVPRRISTTPAPSLATVSASADVYEFVNMSPCRYFISKLTSV